MSWKMLNNITENIEVTSSLFGGQLIVAKEPFAALDPLLSTFLFHLSLIFQIWFGANNNNWHFFASVFAYFSQPHVNAVKRFLRSCVCYYHAKLRFFVKFITHFNIWNVTRKVPKLQINWFGTSAGPKSASVVEKVRAYRLNMVFAEFLVAIRV